jgi:catechol 2,3-dioxygenase-like lactoylglutathione lyase family enzyme
VYLKGHTAVRWTLEVVVLPVSDVDRAKEFYSEKLGFNVEIDNSSGEDFRIVQLTPPGSYCSIAFGKGLAEMPPGSVKGMQLVVPDLPAARKELLERGFDPGEIQFFDPNTGPRSATPEDDLDFSGFLFFSDPDGNGWAIQQISDAKRPGLYS